MTPFAQNRQRHATPCSRFVVTAPTTANAGDTFNVTVSPSIRSATSAPVTRARSTSPARTCRPGCPPTTPSPQPTAARTPSRHAEVVGVAVHRRQRGRRHGRAAGRSCSSPGGGAIAGSGRRRRVHRRRSPDHNRRPRRLRQRRHRLRGHGPLHQLRPAAVLPADMALVNGVATVNVTFMTVGTQTITATDVANPTPDRHGVERRHPAGRRAVRRQRLPEHDRRRGQRRSP